MSKQKNGLEKTNNMSLNSKKIVEGYMKSEDWRVKENSNSPWCFGGLNKYMASEVLKDYTLRNVYTEEIAQAYVNGDIHIHDLGSSGDKTLYCCGYSLKDILLKGVGGVPNIPRSAPAKHFDSILNQIANLDTVYQNEIAGAVAFNSFDTLLAPFAKQDKLTYTQIYQSLQNFIYSINSNSRAGAEPAFSNVTFDLTPPHDLLDEYATIGGELVSFTYRSCQQEIDMINKAFFEIMLGGDYDGKLFSYPIPTFNIHDRFDWDNPNNKLLWEMAGKYGIPYFANFINSDLDISDVRSMCPLIHGTEVFVRSKENGIRKIKIGDAYTGQELKNTQYEVFTKEGWEKAKINQFPKTKIYRIKLSNGSEVCMGENHLQPTKDHEGLLAKDLSIGMWLPFNKTPMMSSLGNYDLGYAIGAYVGDGSQGEGRVIYSLCAFEKDNETEEILTRFWTELGFKVSISTSDKNVRFVCVSSGSYEIVKKYVKGNNALNKTLTRHAFNSSIEFKNGFMDGLRATDGSREKRRIYTSSRQLKDDICALLSSMGKKYLSNYEDNRNNRLGNNTNYRIDFPDKNNYGELFKEDDSYHYFKIISIEAYNNTNADFLYCVELNTANKLFVLGNGLVTHNCRLRLDLSQLQKRNGGLFGAGDATGSIGVCTINLPRIGYLSKTKEELFERIEKQLILCKDSLEIKRKSLEDNIIGTGFLPAFDYYVGTIENHFSTIGIVGMNEMCLNFLGKDILTSEGKQLCLDVGNFINQYLLKFQEETGHLYNYEATPAESTCHRLALLDKKHYPDIITQGSGKSVYYTNSCHIPVNLISSIKETFDHQEDLQIQFSGGTVIHVYTNTAITGDQAKHIVKTVCEEYKVPYVSISPISRYCKDHGYIKEAVDKCPICKSKLKMYQRITGYLRCIDNFNNGKRAEFSDRVQLNGEI